MGKARVARTKKDPDPIEMHPVMLALSKAKAAAEFVDICGCGRDYLQLSHRFSKEEESNIRGWIQSFAQEALTGALGEVEAEFRKSVAERARQEILRPAAKAVDGPRLGGKSGEEGA